MTFIPNSFDDEQAGLHAEPPEDDEPAVASAGYALGDKVRLLKDIWEGEIDGLIPAGYLAREGEVLVVRRLGGIGPSSFGISHENRPDDYFIVFAEEVERA